MAYIFVCVCVLVLPANDQLLLVVKEKVSPEWSPSLELEEPEALHIKEEQEQLCTSQDGKQLNVLEEADTTRFLFTAIPFESQDDNEEHQTSQLHQSQTEDKEEEFPASSSATQIKAETGGEDCGGTKPVRNLGMSSHLQPNTDGKASDSSENEDSYDEWQEPLSDSGPETKGSDIWEEMQAAKSGVNAVKCVKTTVSNVVCNTGKKSFSCSQCGKDFHYKRRYDVHMRVHTGGKPFACDVCGKRFKEKANYKRHMRVHTGEKPFACDVCSKRFTEQGTMKKHMKVHTGEKPFGCDVCNKRFGHRYNLKKHMSIHTRENPLSVAHYVLSE